MTHVTRKLARVSLAAIYSAGKTRAIVVELEPPGDLVGFRLKGTRTVYFLPVAECYRLAVRAEMDRRKAEKRKARKGVR